MNSKRCCCSLAGRRAVALFAAMTVTWAAVGRTQTDVAEPTTSGQLGAVISPRPGAVEPLSLEACVKEALRANDHLRAERMRRSELRGQMKQALATGLPSVDLVGDWTRGRDPSFALDSTFGGSGGGFGSVPGADPWFNDWLSGFGSLIPAPAEIQAQTFWRANANFNWTINPTLVLGAVGAAKLGLDQQALNVRAAENDIADQTIGAYFSIIKAAEELSAVEAEIANQTELLAIMQMRNELGLATRLDTLQAAVSRANIVPRRGLARANLRNTGSRLNALLGRRPEDPVSVLNNQALELTGIRDEVALRLAQRRPELRSDEIFVDILHKNRQAQVADNRPYLTVFGSYGYVGTGVSDLFDEGHDSWRASVALNVPLFDGLDTRGRVAETKARIRRNEAELSGRRRAVQVEVMEVLANLRMAREILVAAQLNLERSQEVLSESLLMLKLGQTNYLDVLVAESNRAQARSNLIAARYEVIVLTSSLKRSVGYSPLLPLTSIPQLSAEVAQ